MISGGGRELATFGAVERGLFSSQAHFQLARVMKQSSLTEGESGDQRKVSSTNYGLVAFKS
jgi:hypothetical protein